jgi:uncharacterized metal-binding protein
MSKHREYKALPLLYSCSGCSSAAQLANHVAVNLDRRQIAEMSCIAGVGGDVPSLVRTARSGRPIIALDGCALHCVKNTLARQGVEAKWHYTLSDFGVRKRYHADFSADEADAVIARVVGDVGEAEREDLHGEHGVKYEDREISTECAESTE